MNKIRRSLHGAVTSKAELVLLSQASRLQGWIMKKDDFSPKDFEEQARGMVNMCLLITCVLDFRYFLEYFDRVPVMNV